MSETLICRDVGQLSPKAQIACMLFLERCRAEGLDVLITETYRSQKRQNYLYSLGRTRSGNKVTWTLKSRHTSRRAWDICKNEKGAEYSDSTFFKRCGEIAKSLGITWGGAWKTPDTPHFEISETWQEPEGVEIDMEELKALKEQYEAYVNHTTQIINAMGSEIQSLQDIINVMGKEIDELKKRS